MTTFEITTLLPSESREIRESIKALFPDARFERFDPACFNVTVSDSDSGRALDEFLDAETNKLTTMKYRLI